MNNFNQANPQFRQPRKPKEVHSKEPKWNLGVRILVSALITLVIAAVVFYFTLPAINFQNPGLYNFLITHIVIFTVCMVIFGGFRSNKSSEIKTFVKKKLLAPVIIIGVLIVVMLVGSIAGWALIRAKDYAELIELEDGNFAEDVEEIGWDQIPMLDSASSNNLADRKLGELSDLVSQFDVSENSAQINYQDKPVRVNYLDYNGFFKWINNRKAGIPAYVMVDMRTQDVTVVRLEEGIKYSPSEYFGRNLYRHLRFKYPTFLFGDVNFEIDEEGVPYWVASVNEKKIGLFDGTDTKGAVLLNAVTGESKYYAVKDVPTWVDRVYDADIVLQQYNYKGLYSNGFFNSLFSQTNCTETTRGYNYIAQDDDVWVYTGITSVTGDRGNIGFILVNQRTKEAKYYVCAGAEEYSAMASAEGAVQQYRYKSTFPLLLNVSKQPTYFMAMKDEGGLVKMYAMVNVQQYQIVATGSTLSDCQENYHTLLIKNGLIKDGEVKPEPTPDKETKTEKGQITEIRSAIIDGNTVYYVLIGEGKTVFTFTAKDYSFAPLLNVGDSISVEYVPNESGIVPVKKLMIVPEK